MSVYFDSSRVIGYGLSGQHAAQQMAEAVETSFKGKCHLVYNEETKIFTILNSSEISIETIQQIFSKYKYDYWKPNVEKLTDSEGNKTAKLIFNLFFSSPLNQVRAHSSTQADYEAWLREKASRAREEVLKLRYAAEATVKALNLPEVKEYFNS